MKVRFTRIKGNLPKGATPFVLFLVLISATLIGSRYAYNLTENYNNERFNRVKGQVVTSISTRLQYYNNSLLQAAALFTASEEVNEKEFKIYARSMGLKDQYPGMTAIGYSRHVPASKLDQYLKDRKQTPKNFKVWPQGKKYAVYTPVQFIEPYYDQLQPLIGYNLMNNSELADAQTKALVEGRPIITEEFADKKNIFAIEKVKSDKGFFVFYPVYKNEDTPPTEALRIEKIQGYVFGLFNTDHFFETIMKEFNNFDESVGVSIKQGESETELFNSLNLFGPDIHSPKLSRSEQFTLTGTTWTITVFSLPSLEKTYDQKYSWIILILGSILSFLCLFFMVRIVRNNRQLRKSQKETKKVARDNSIIAKAGEDFASSLDTDQSLKKFASFMADNFADFCVMDYFEEEGNQQIIIPSKKFTTETGLTKQRMKGLAAQFVLSEDLPQKVRQNDNFVHGSSPESDIFSSYAAIPISSRGKLYAIASLVSKKDRSSLYERKANLLKHLGKMGAVALENTLLFNEAQLANRLKDEFLATVSHELRTPLSVIHGHAELLLETELSDDQKEQVESIYRSAKAQGAIIEDILDISSIISGKITYEPRPLKVVNAIDTALGSVKLEAKRKGVQLVFRDVSQCIIMGVKTRLVQIFWNLFSNAIKFTPPGGKVIVSTSVENQNCIIKIRDTGKGIDPEFLPHIFEKFKQEEIVSTRNMGGLGLGLSIVSHLVSLHGGSVSAESEGKDKGATFTVTFPVVSLTAKTGPIEEKEKREQIERHDLHDISILAVDDEAESLNLIARILRSYKARVITASSGEDALKMIRTERPDVLISDIAMPEMDGYQLIKEVRSKERAQGTHIPAIALTAFAQDEDKERALRSGYEAYLSKPVNKEILIGTVEQALH